MSDKGLTIEQTLTLLAEGPTRIAALTADLSPQQLRMAPVEDDWSVNDVLAHLRSCADVWGGCIAVILGENHPTIKAVNPRTWIKQTDYFDLEFRPSFEVFTAQRAALMTVLEPLLLESWARAATVKVAGKPLIRTVHTYAESIAIHERPHLKQIARIVKTMKQS